jgi:hypothetical protein
MPGPYTVFERTTEQVTLYRKFREWKRTPDPVERHHGVDDTGPVLQSRETLIHGLINVVAIAKEGKSNKDGPGLLKDHDQRNYATYLGQ